MNFRVLDLFSGVKGEEKLAQFGRTEVEQYLQMERGIFGEEIFKMSKMLWNHKV